MAVIDLPMQLPSRLTGEAAQEWGIRPVMPSAMPAFNGPPPLAGAAVD